MYRRASLTKEQLTWIYELMYKYGWLIAEERESMGELSDQAYNLKSSVEGQLREEISDGIAGIIESYDTWLYTHKNWAKLLKQNSADDLDNIYVANVFDVFDTYQFDYEDFIFNLILPYIPGIDKRDLKQPYYREVQLDALRDKYHSRNHRRLINDFSDIIVENMDKVIQWGHQAWHRKFPKLEETIPRIERTLKYLETVVNDPNLTRQIQAFNVGLTTGHVTGSMADHILNMPNGQGKAFLDHLSAGPRSEWDQELSRVLGHPPGKDIFPKKTSFLKLMRRVARILRLAARS